MTIRYDLTHRHLMTWVGGLALLVGALFFSACSPARFFAPGHGPKAGGPDVLLEPSHKPEVFYFLQSELSRKNGDLDMALSAMNKAIAADPDATFLKTELARLLVYKNELPEALKLVRQGLEDQPENTEYLGMLAQIKLIQNNEADVPPIFEKILSISPDDQAVYYLLGGLYSKMNQIQKAIETFQRLIDRFPESFSGHYYLGKLHMVDKGFDAAEKHLIQAHTLNPDLTEALFSLIQIYEAQGKDHLLPDVYTQILKDRPEDIRASLALALIHHSEGNEEKAEAILGELAVRSADDPDVLRHVVRHYIKKNQYPDAVYLIETLLTTAPRKDDLYYFLGICHQENKNLAAATRAFEQVTAGSRYYEKAVLVSAFHYMDTDENHKAITTLEKALEVLPENAEFILYLGSFYEEEEQYQKAVDMYLKGLALDSKSSRLYFRLGVVYDKKGDRLACIDKMKQVIALDPEDANALNYLGYTYADLGMNLEEAEDLISRALSFKPNDGYITDSLGWVYYKKGHYEKAVATLEKAVTMIPDDPILLEHLGDAFLKSAKPQKALEAYQRSLKNKKKGGEELRNKINHLINQQTFLKP